MARLEVALRSLFTLIVVALAVWWLLMVASRIGTAPTKDAQGNIVVDEYARTKDILLVVLPLVTTVYGYWFGAQGKTNAEAKADKAQREFQAVVATGEPDLLQKAMTKYPEAFTKTNDGRGGNR